MLVNAKKILTDATKDGYGICAYNINNLEWTKYILEALKEDRSPIILEITPSTVNYFGGYKTVSNLVKSLISDLEIKNPIVLHLDHGKSFEDCKNAIDNGFTSVMIDASNLSLEENIEVTRSVVDYAKTKNVTVEAELGSFYDDNYTNPDDALSFVSATEIDFLAPSVGNKHGIYEDASNINFELLGEISKKTKVPLVLHGASGLDFNKLKTAVFCGVSKININTELQIAWSKAVRNYLNNDDKVYDPKKIIASGKYAIKEIIHKYSEVLGSKNKM